MKALTICQPYAELICLGEKFVENRRWVCGHRGPLLIHAGKSRSWLKTYAPLPDPMAFGAIVGRCELVDEFRLDGGRIPQSALNRHPYLADHPHVEGPWCWVLSVVERLERPMPCRGQQGLFDVDPGELAAAAGYPLVWYQAGPPARYCRVCGCTEHTPCEEGCYWTERGSGPADLCSVCAKPLTPEP